jgi:hypothetical protein
LIVGGNLAVDSIQQQGWFAATAVDARLQPGHAQLHNEKTPLESLELERGF